MNFLPEEICKAWANRDKVTILATAGESNLPNVIYVTCVELYQSKKIVIADNYFDKTRKNILAGSKGSFLFKTRENKTYQIKGFFEYVTEGEIFDFMKTWNPLKHPGHAAAILNPEEIYSGAEKLY
ncbi:MAG: pyridoxamine 5-phosphate oxidase [Lentisphaerae bacterium GWF2_44_16]|nr:MAG: pyridoxamine 5-phosphate oxidase [Lentisphaerae bacterium GWF2_44_16]